MQVTPLGPDLEVIQVRKMYIVSASTQTQTTWRTRGHRSCRGEEPRLDDPVFYAGVAQRQSAPLVREVSGFRYSPPAPRSLMLTVDKGAHNSLAQGRHLQGPPYSRCNDRATDHPELHRRNGNMSSQAWCFQRFAEAKPCGLSILAERNSRNARSFLLGWSLHVPLCLYTNKKAKMKIVSDRTIRY